MKTIYGRVFSPEYLSQEALPKISKEFTPWLKKDRDIAVVGEYTHDKDGKLVHNGQGSEAAERQLKAVETVYREKSYAPAQEPFVLAKLENAKNNLVFWQGKLSILDRLIASGGV